MNFSNSNLNNPVPILQQQKSKITTNTFLSQSPPNHYQPKKTVVNSSQLLALARVFFIAIGIWCIIWGMTPVKSNTSSPYIYIVK
jgi:hypothetical protein